LTGNFNNGAFYVVKESGLEIWSGMKSLTQERVPGATIIRDGAKAYFNRLVLNPPDEPFVAMKFSKKFPETSTLKINHDRNVLWLSLSGLGKPWFTRFSVGHVRKLLQERPDFTNTQWSEAIRLLDSNRRITDKKTLTKQDKVRIVLGNLIDIIPSFNSGEAELLKYAASDGKKNESTEVNA
jgi:hypothetical protein